MSERIVKTLPVMLTDAQVNEWARKAAALAGEEDDRATQLESAKERAKTIVKEAESALSSKRIERSQAARIARERCEWKEVDCEEKIARADRRAVVTRLDTMEHVSSRPVSDDEMRRGATWKPNLTARRSELRHPEEPDVLLDTRPLSDAEKQVPLPGADGQVKAATLAEAAAIAAAREKGDLPPAPEGEPYEPKGPATSVTSEQLDALTPVEAKPESKVPSLASTGIELRTPSNDNNAGAAPTATVFVLSLEEAARPETAKLSVYDFLPDAAGTQLESRPVDAADAKLLREAAQRAGVAVRERTVTGRPSPTHFKVSALRSAYEALSDENKDLLNEDVRAPDGRWLYGYWNDGAKDERIEYCGVVTRAESDALLEYTKGLGLEAVAAPVDEYPCSEPGCEYWEQFDDLAGGGGTCHDHTVTRDKLKKKLAKPAGAAPKKGGKKGKVDEAKQLEALVVKHTDLLNAAKSAGALGDAWRAVAGLDLPDGHLARLEGVFDAKAKRLGLSPSTLAQMRAEDRAPAERPADAASA
jgi:hypothetical protein